MKTIRKIVLAVDPFTDEPEATTEKVARSIRGMIKDSKVEVEAVYVMSPAGVGLPLLKFPEHQEYFKLRAIERIRRAIDTVAPSLVTQITVLPQGSNSIRNSVETLLNYIEESGADLIALSTHARKGMDRLFMGSFAETLLLKTRFPLLISNPITPWDPSYRNLLYASDLSDKLEQSFETTLAIAKFLKSHVTLFHRIAPENVLMMPPGFFTMNEWTTYKMDAQARAMNMKDQAELQGIPLEIDVDQDSASVPTAILSAAERCQASLIVMSARRGSGVFAMGSIPRQMIRNAHCPVLLIPLKY